MVGSAQSCERVPTLYLYSAARGVPFLLPSYLLPILIEVGIFSSYLSIYLIYFFKSVGCEFVLFCFWTILSVCPAWRSARNLVRNLSFILSQS